MKKILIGLTYYRPNISGVSEYAKILADNINKNKFSIRVLTAKFKKDLKNKEEDNGVEIYRIDGMPLGKGFIMWTYFIKSISQIRWADVINCHLPSIESFWLCFWGKIFNKKIIITHHCEFGIDGPLSNKIIGILSFPIHFFSYLMANKIVAYTQDYANHSMFLRIFKKKIIYFWPPIKINPSPRCDTGVSPFDKGDNVVGYVGRIGWEKGLSYLIEAMKKVNAKLILVGPYQEVVGDKTYEKLKKIINNKVEFAGPMAHENLGEFYSKIDCLVLPSINNLETFGIVQAESMVCGTPVVASNLPGVRVPIKTTGMGEICQLKDSDDLAEKINMVLKNGKKYYQKKARNLQFFDYKKTVIDYEKLFRTV